MTTDAYVVYGVTRSYFTRKVTGYLDYKRIPWHLRRGNGVDARVIAAGYPGGMPAVCDPNGEVMWDSTAVIHHLEERFPEPSVLPPDPVLRFLCYAIEDLSDEWLYRPAVGTRWLFEENATSGSLDLARDLTVEVPLSCDQARQIIQAHVTSTLAPLGVTTENIQAWVDEVLRPWQCALGVLLRERPFLFGNRPSLADFALFGGNAAHFINDPLCRRWADEDAPQVVQHTHRLLQPDNESFGDWSDELPEAMVALLADLGRLYLPWLSKAAANGAAGLVFRGGERIDIRATDFLREAHGVLLARYASLRCPRLDAVLERAGILAWYRDNAALAGTIPSYSAPPRPTLNRPFPPA